MTIKPIQAREVRIGDVIQQEPGSPYLKVVNILPDHLHNGFEMRCQGVDQEWRSVPLNAEYGYIRLVHRPELICAKCADGDHCVEDDNRGCACCWKVL